MPKGMPKMETKGVGPLLLVAAVIGLAIAGSGNSKDTSSPEQDTPQTQPAGSKNTTPRATEASLGAQVAYPSPGVVALTLVGIRCPGTEPASYSKGLYHVLSLAGVDPSLDSKIKKQFLEQIPADTKILGVQCTG